MLDVQSILRPYNPWFEDQNHSFGSLPGFHRPIFDQLYEDIEKLPQILSITGPRRIGKSTLLRQLIRKLISQKIPPSHIVYYSFDDPALLSRGVDVNDVIDWMMKKAMKQKETGPTYLFLDEIQRLERWELYLKKFYDLSYPVRIVVSGSASSPIFKKSRESLMGRIKETHLLPFSFREYALLRSANDVFLSGIIETAAHCGKQIQARLVEDPAADLSRALWVNPTPALQVKLDSLLVKYMDEGGFPEVWTLPDRTAKQDYLFDNQVKKVIYEDLILATELRKPELLKQFYISLLEAPGREVNTQKIASATGIRSSQIEKYLPLLEMTDLVYRVPKFRSGKLQVRRGLVKFYLVDLALRNAVLRLGENLAIDPGILGLYAENLVFLLLRRVRGFVQIDYYRDQKSEIDFIAHVGPRRYLAIEVKYQNLISNRDEAGLRHFSSKYPARSTCYLVTKKWSDFNPGHDIRLIPLPMFLLHFD